MKKENVKRIQPKPMITSAFTCSGPYAVAFTCTGPYAVLIMCGIKRAENRSARISHKITQQCVSHKCVIYDTMPSVRRP